MVIAYELLPATDVSNNRCGVMLENQLQCGERAQYKNLREQMLLCKHHMQLEIQLGTEIGDDYIVVDTFGNEIKNAEVFQPSQKPNSNPKLNR